MPSQTPKQWNGNGFHLVSIAQQRAELAKILFFESGQKYVREWDVRPVVKFRVEASLVPNPLAPLLCPACLRLQAAVELKIWLQGWCWVNEACSRSDRKFHRKMADTCERGGGGLCE